MSPIEFTLHSLERKHVRHPGNVSNGLHIDPTTGEELNGIAPRSPVTGTSNLPLLEPYSASAPVTLLLDLLNGFGLHLLPSGLRVSGKLQAKTSDQTAVLASLPGLLCFHELNPHVSSDAPILRCTRG